MLSRRSVLLFPIAVVCGFLGFSSVLPLAAASGPLTAEGAPGSAIKGSAPVTVTLHLSSDARNILQKMPDRPADGPTVRLNLNGFKAPAGAGVRVFLNFPQAGASSGTDDRHYVGAMSSFDTPAAGAPGDDIILDAAPTLRKLRGKNERVLPGDNVAVTLVLVAGSAPDDASVTLDKVGLTVEPKAK
ncbi:MAG TPA: hypothetical protein VGQ28_08015 [Thermoanaerobaculia bacterium]|jgi:hypothetical protein|nr:hypothetical protein [Thermoanaerobaculia bacterium]